MEEDLNQQKINNNANTDLSVESLDSWTLISDTVKQKQSSNENSTTDSTPSGVEIIENDEELKTHEDDLSDGISIISDSESAGRASPIQNNESNDNNKKLNYETTTATPSTSTETDISKDQSSQTTQQSKSFAAKAIISTSSTTDEIDNVPTNLISSLAATQSNQTAVFSIYHLKIPKIIVISIFIALIAAFFGNLKYNLNSQQAPQLHQRVEELELQNNLLRAEIDILSKNMKSLNQQKQQQQLYPPQNGKEKYIKKEEKYKKRNDNNIVTQNQGEIKNNKPIFNDNDEFKEELKKINPYISTDSNTNIQPKPVEEYVLANPPNANNDLPTYCKDGENLWCPTEESTTQPKESASLSQAEIPQKSNGNYPNYEQSKSNGQESKKWEEKQYKEKYRENEQKRKYENKKTNQTNEYHNKKKFGKNPLPEEYKKYENKNYNGKYEERREQRRGEKNYDHSKERFDKHQQRRQNDDRKFDSDDDDNNREHKEHKERGDKNNEYHHRNFKTTDKYRDNSGERYNSKESYEKKNQKQNNGKIGNKKNKKRYHSDDDDDDDDDFDDWHEKLMQHREYIRKNSKKNNDDNNWYLERGNSREEARIVENKNE